MDESPALVGTHQFTQPAAVFLVVKNFPFCFVSLAERNLGGDLQLTSASERRERSDCKGLTLMAVLVFDIALRQFLGESSAWFSLFPPSGCREPFTLDFSEWLCS